MGIEDGTYEFTLSRALEYRADGEAAYASTIILREPGMDHLKFYARLKQMLMRAQMELATQAGEINKMREAIGQEVKPLNEDAQGLEEQTDDIADGISLALQAANNVDMADFVETFRQMACLKARRPIALIDGKQAMTDPLWATLKPDDAINMAVRWCAFFAMPSEQGGQTTSGPQSESHTQRTEA